MKLIVVLCTLCSAIFGEIARREVPISLKTSVIIPCVAYHFSYLEQLLDSLSQQSVLPDEVVVCLSEVKALDPQGIVALKNQPWPFALQIIEQQERRSAGVNRNIACREATGDLLITQDADDIPHPQRVQIAKYLFEHYELDHLIHRWISANQEFQSYDVMAAELICFQQYDEIDRAYEFVHNGNICFRAEMAKHVQWKDDLKADHDVRFNRDVYEQFPNHAFLPWSLVLYRPELSAFVYHKNLSK